VLLAGIAFFEEMASGVATAGGPEIQRAFGTSYAELATIVLLVPGIAGLVLEPPLFLLADRWPRRPMIVAALAVMALAALASAIAPNAIVLAAAVSASAVANGLVTGLSEATLLDAAPDRRASTMTRFMLLGLFGDLAAPLLLVGCGAIGLGWRGAFAVLAGLLAAWAVGIAARPLPRAPANAGEDAADDEPRMSLVAVLAASLRDRRLVAWLLGLVLCDLLDEILVVLASLHLRDELGAGPEWRTALIGAFVAGGAVGLAVVDRLLARVGSARILVGSGVACAITYALWLASPTPLVAVILMLPVGATAAPLYPLASAQAFAARPGHSGALLAASHLFTPIALALPWALGAVADAAGTYVALALLVLQPIGIAVLARTIPIEGARAADAK
jgi:MFS family permease